MRKVLEMMLKKSGAEVVLAGSGDEALKKFDPDTSLIISDYYMPAMSGIDFIKAIRSGAVNHNVPILILTTERSPELVAEGRTAGASGWINKPVRQGCPDKDRRPLPEQGGVLIWPSRLFFPNILSGAASGPFSKS